MKLIADSGSTKTSWQLITPAGEAGDCVITAGINPFFQQSSDIVETLRSELILDVENVTDIFFYGAGAANDLKKRELYVALNKFFGIGSIEIESDLVAAAHSLCGHQEGIAAILGTGSNSCYYDGKQVVKFVSPLGYILGDEGSGAVLGKKLLSDVLKNQLPQQLIKLFFETYSTTSAEIIENVYRKPFPNRYMASYTRFLSANIHFPELHALVKQSFCDFFLRNIAQFDKAGSLPVNFTGSVAWYFSAILTEAAGECGFSVGRIVMDPMPGLIDYHRTSHQD